MLLTLHCYYQSIVGRTDYTSSLRIETAPHLFSCLSMHLQHLAQWLAESGPQWIFATWMHESPPTIFGSRLHHSPLSRASASSLTAGFFLSICTYAQNFPTLKQNKTKNLSGPDGYQPLSLPLAPATMELQGRPSLIGRAHARTTQSLVCPVPAGCVPTTSQEMPWPVSLWAPDSQGPIVAGFPGEGKPFSCCSHYTLAPLTHPYAPSWVYTGSFSSFHPWKAIVPRAPSFLILGVVLSCFPVLWLQLLHTSQCLSNLSPALPTQKSNCL